MYYKNLFLRQSYLDNYSTYSASLKAGPHRPALWDYVILTASNEDQAESYRFQIDHRLKHGVLPAETHYAVIPDRDGKRVGSGGATLGVLRYIRSIEDSFESKRILVIHSGGDSKRVPQYSACGKLFSPVPRELPDGRPSTLFDELLIGMSGVAGRIEAGMLVLSGDVLLLFNPLQIDFYSNGAVALSMKEPTQTGKNHGVFVRGKDRNVKYFLHKQTAEFLRASGAADERDNINIDTGAIILSTDILNDLYSLVDTDEKYDTYVNETVRLSFYGDFVYPLASGSTLEDFYKEKPEGSFCPELHDARTVLWDLLHKYSMKLLCLSPASFLHFGTSTELLKLVCTDIADYRFLEWSNLVYSNRGGDFAAYNSCISKHATVGSGSYIENSLVGRTSSVGKNSIVSGCTLEDVDVPDNVILHTLPLRNGKYVTRILGINDNPKENVFLGQPLHTPLWEAPLFAEADSAAESARLTLSGVTGPYSLMSSFNLADTGSIIIHDEKMRDLVDCEKLLANALDRVPLNKCDQITLSETSITRICRAAEKADFSDRIRIYYYAGTLSGNEEVTAKCFSAISDAVLEACLNSVNYDPTLRIATDKTVSNLPVRVNWGGGWTDTAPYCLENGGNVLNAAVTLNGQKPIIVTIQKIDRPVIIFSSTDYGSYREFTDIHKLQRCSNPNDAYALHKAAIIACGIIPAQGDLSVEEICRRIGGGFLMNTEVVNIPRGSGLGTSSILAGGCVKAIFDFFGKTISEEELYDRVMCVEQIMSTGGGWQDQVGGIAPGIKLVSSPAGIKQKISCQTLNLSDSIRQKLDSRFCLIYTGQRRLARNLLREVVGKYIGSDEQAAAAMVEINSLALEMTDALKTDDFDRFCQLLNRHWEASKKLDSECTNTCIDQIFGSIEDLIDGKMICGAGGGGFLQVVLKEGITHQDLDHRLYSVFSDSGVCVYRCDFVYE